MKITVEIDCTPTEARAFFGMPDLQPMQERLLSEMEQRFRDAAQRLSPETITQRWFEAWPAAMGPMREAFDKMLKPSSSG